MGYKYILDSSVLSEGDLHLFLSITDAKLAKTRLAKIKEDADQHFKGTKNTVHISTVVQNLTVVR